MSLLSVLNVGTRALFASQLAMDVAGQNISNADVEGYSRKRLNLQPDYRYDSTYGQIGIGVEVVNIERLRNIFIDEQIRRQNQQVGYYEELDNTLESIENIFTEPSDTGVIHFVDQFFDSWQNLANNPSDISARTMVRTNAEILIDVFHNVSAELTNLRQTRNEEIQQQVNKINEICKEIHNLNLEIGTVELNNQNANDSRDRRDLLLKELSKIIEVSVVENDNGQVTITTSGNIIVSPVFYQELETTSASTIISDGTTIMETSIRFSDSKNMFKPQGGTIKGLFESRDKIIPEYQKQLDTLANALVEKINDLHSRGYNLKGFTGINFFDPDLTGASDIKLSASIITDVNNIAAASGGETHPASQNLLSAGSHDFGGAPVQLYRDPSALPLVKARNILNGSVIVTAGPTTLVEGTDYHIDYVNGTIQMLHGGYDSEDLQVDFNYRSGGFAGPGDNSTALAIANLRSELTMNNDIHGNGTSTFAEYYSSMIGRLGLSRNEADSNLETRIFLVNQFETHQDAIAGVSLDEEMADLIKYQHTYQAAARLISTTDEMLDVLLKM
jgi:flagellar hook-associated protein 1 FlgK